MPHCLLVGMTESGKTTLAKRLVHQYKAAGRGVLVLDAICNPDWNADFVTDDPEDFLDTYWRSQSCVAMIDEAGDEVGRFNTAMIQTATKGRHWGHSNHYMVQRGAMLSPTVRAQCRHVFMFCSAVDDCKVLRNEYNNDELLRGGELVKGEYIHVQRFVPGARRGQLFKDATQFEVRTA